LLSWGNGGFEGLWRRKRRQLRLKGIFIAEGGFVKAWRVIRPEFRTALLAPTVKPICLENAK
jgi:hypothetical protein